MPRNTSPPHTPPPNFISGAQISSESWHPGDLASMKQAMRSAIWGIRRARSHIALPTRRSSLRCAIKMLEIPLDLSDFRPEHFSCPPSSKRTAFIMCSETAGLLSLEAVTRTSA